MKVRSRAILPGSGRPEHQTTGPLPQPSATIHPARDDLVVALRRRTPVDRNAHDRDSVSFRRSFFNTHRRLRSEPGCECNDSITMSAPTPEYTLVALTNQTTGERSRT